MTLEISVETIWHVPDDLWNLITPLLGRRKRLVRPAIPYRRIFDGIVYVLRTGCQWRALPREQFAAQSTVWGRFNQWVEAEVFQAAWALVLTS